MERPPQNKDSGKASDPEGEDEEFSSDGKPVGYKRPPARTQFKKGRSGNPKGRPKGSESMSKLLHEVLAERVPVTQNGNVTRMSKAEALVQLTMARAVKGDTKAIVGMLAFAEKLGRLDEPKEEDGENAPGMVLVPEQVSDEEWERLYGADARGEKHLNHDQLQPRKVTRPVKIETVDALTEKEMYEEALAGYRYFLARCEATIAKDGNSIETQDRMQLVISRIAFIGLKFIETGKLAMAIDVLEQAIQLAPTDLRWHRLRALAFMLYGNVHQSRAIYLEHCDNEEWKAATLVDFEVVRRAGFAHPYMDEIEKLFTADGSGQAG